MKIPENRKEEKEAKSQQNQFETLGRSEIHRHQIKIQKKNPLFPRKNE